MAKKRRSRTATAREATRLVEQGVSRAEVARRLGVTRPYKGHPLSGPNLRIDSRGFRVCITCQRATQRRYNARKKLASPSETE